MPYHQHDLNYKQVFSEPEMIRDLLLNFVDPNIVQQLDLSTLERVNSSFVSEDLQARESDVIWRIKVADAEWLYLYFLLEFQSSIDPWMALRLAEYVIALYRDLLKQK